MSEYSTIESFFLADYEKLRKENEEPKNTINEYELQFKACTSEDGFTDLGKSVCREIISRRIEELNKSE